MKLRVGSGEQADGVEGGDGQRGEEEQPGHVAAVLDGEPARSPRKSSATQANRPSVRSTCQKRPEIEVLEP